MAPSDMLDIECEGEWPRNAAGESDRKGFGRGSEGNAVPMLAGVKCCDTGREGVLGPPNAEAGAVVACLGEAMAAGAGLKSLGLLEMTALFLCGLPVPMALALALRGGNTPEPSSTC